MRRYRAGRVMSVLMVTLGIIGCERREVVNKGPEGVCNLLSLAKAYTRTAAGVRTPRSIEDIMPALKTIGDPQGLLRSPRDGKPYVIVWGVDIRSPVLRRNGMSGSDAPIIAYEQEGRDGKRQAVNLTLRGQEYSAEEVAQLKLTVPRNFDR
jgi:hypothetical protein